MDVKVAHASEREKWELSVASTSKKATVRVLEIKSCVVCNDFTQKELWRNTSEKLSFSSLDCKRKKKIAFPNG